VRRFFVTCRRQYTPAADTLRSMSISEGDASKLVFYRAVGCDDCNHTGYRGRIGIYEVMRVTDKLRRLISTRGGEDTIREVALAAGMTSLGEDGVAKVKAGLTTPEELLRVVTEVRELRTLCPGCSGTVALDFVVCPHCSRRLSGGCQRCGRAQQPGWNFCPYCTTSNAPRSRKLRQADRRSLEMIPTRLSEFKKA
jgi:hypothetical protein